MGRSMILSCLEQERAMSQSSFVDAFLAPGAGRNKRLERIEALIDWAPVAALVKSVRPGETGRPPYAPLSMVKALLLQRWYGLSDPGLEEALVNLLFDAETSGGLLIAIAPDRAALVERELRARELPVHALGEFVQHSGVHVEIV